MATTAGPVEETIRHKLVQALAPQHLEVINESHRHNVPAGSETHFKVVVVSDKFEGLQLIKRHRLVNTALQQELARGGGGGVHALAIAALAPRQWAEAAAARRAAEPSPACLGGFGK